MKKTLKFGKYPADGFVATLEEYYKDGFETGASWKEDYIPGGPWVCSYGFILTHDADWQAYCQHTKDGNAEWLRGFKAGLDSQSSNPLKSHVS